MHAPSAPGRARLRTAGLVVGGLLVVLALSATGFARLYTDRLWFESIGYEGVWRRILLTRIGLVTGFTLLFFVLAWGNLRLADRLAPRRRLPSGGPDLLTRYDVLLVRRSGALRLVVSLVLALVAGGGTSSQWESWLLFRHPERFGWKDPLHGVDAGFYVFQLPFLSFVVDWLFASLVVTAVLVAGAHYLNGGIRRDGGSERVAPAVKLHLSILLFVVAIVRAAGYVLDRYQLVGSHRGTFDGAFAADVDVKLPALNLLVLISLFAAMLFLANAWRRGWVLPMAAVGLWAFSHLVVGSAFPALYQRLRVEPEQSTREATYIGRNIKATRYGLGLDQVQARDVPADGALTRELVESNRDIVGNIRILDPQLAVEAFTRTQGERDFYRFSQDLDVDRYLVDGQLRQVVLSARQLDGDAIDASWENEHVAFTHGYGLALSAANAVGPSGLPQFLISGLGSELRVDPGFERRLDQPRLYFSEGLEGYAIVGATRPEIDYTTSNNQSVMYRYEGRGGIPMGSWWRRAAFSLRFGTIDPLISRFVTSDSQLLYRRDVRQRVQAVAPFLRFDADPYPVVADGRISWVIDAYTTSSRFPYAQRADTESLPRGSGLDGGFNYVRASVKAVVDAYDGTVTLYTVDEQDPLARAYRRAFPGLLHPVSEASAELRSNFRYPEDLFRVQTNMYASYFVDDPVDFSQGNITWDVAQDPGHGVAGAAASTAPSAQGTAARRTARIDPQYLVTRLPGEERLEFVLLRPFVLQSATDERPELTAFMVATRDGGSAPRLIVYRLQAGAVSAPSQVDDAIRRDAQVAPRISLLNQQGSTVSFGDMVLVPLGDALVYVRPMYVQAEGGTAIPELQAVITVHGDQVAIGDTLDEALRGITSDEPGQESAPLPGGSDGGAEAAPSVPPQTSPSPPVDLGQLSVAELVSSAERWLSEAEVAEAAGDKTAADVLRARALAALSRMGEVLGLDESARDQDPVPPEPSDA